MYWDWQDDIQKRARERLRRLQAQKHHVAEQRSRLDQKKAKEEELKLLAAEIKEGMKMAHDADVSHGKSPSDSSRLREAQQTVVKRAAIDQKTAGNAVIGKHSEVLLDSRDDEKSTFDVKARNVNEERGHTSSAMKIRRQENDSISRKLKEQMEKEARSKRYVFALDSHFVSFFDVLTQQLSKQRFQEDGSLRQSNYYLKKVQS